jgi:hypothetical protein
LVEGFVIVADVKKQGLLVGQMEVVLQLVVNQFDVFFVAVQEI